MGNDDYIIINYNIYYHFTRRDNIRKENFSSTSSSKENSSTRIENSSTRIENYKNVNIEENGKNANTVELKLSSLFKKYCYMWSKENPNNNWTCIGLLVNINNPDFNFLLLENDLNKQVYFIYNEAIDGIIAILDDSSAICQFLENNQQVMINKLLKYGYFKVHLFHNCN